MDYADGGDLNTKLQEQKKKGTYFDENQIITWFTQICLALQHIHSHKILHRDLKAQNVFLMQTGQVKVGDFGIAKILDGTADLAETAIGTPYYLSPEICEKKPYNYKSDIWGLGCVLYEMLTFKRPFEASSIGGLVISILNGKYKPISAHWSKNIKNLVSNLLSVNPNTRMNIDEILSLEFIKSKISELSSNPTPPKQNILIIPKQKIKKAKTDMSMIVKKTFENEENLPIVKLKRVFLKIVGKYWKIGKKELQCKFCEKGNEENHGFEGKYLRRQFRL